MKNKITEIPPKGGIVIYRAKDKKIQRYSTVFDSKQKLFPSQSGKWIYDAT